MGLWGRGRKGHGLPDVARQALGLGRGDRIMAVAQDQRTSEYVVATTTALAAVSGDGVLRMRRPWHEVSAGAWEPQTQTISVTWVDGGRAAQWTLAGAGDGGEAFAGAFYERVATSVLIDAPIEIDGKPLGRVAIRRDLGGDDLIRQIMWARGVRRDDPQALAYADLLLTDLAEQVGLV